jgi:serine phosphatase RsbU (regulator of sigma subunit)
MTKMHKKEKEINNTKETQEAISNVGVVIGNTQTDNQRKDRKNLTQLVENSNNDILDTDKDKILSEEMNLKDTAIINKQDEDQTKGNEMNETGRKENSMGNDQDNLMIAPQEVQTSTDEVPETPTTKITSSNSDRSINNNIDENLLENDKNTNIENAVSEEINCKADGNNNEDNKKSTFDDLVLDSVENDIEKELEKVEYETYLQEHCPDNESITLKKNG